MAIHIQMFKPMKNSTLQCLGFKFGLSGLALATLLGQSPSLAATQATAPATESESDSVVVANLFRQIGDAIRSVGEIVETVNTVDSLLQQITDDGNGAPQTQPPTAPHATTPAAISDPATAQPSRSAPSQEAIITQVLHRDDAPYSCGTAGGRDCESFQITRRVLPSGDAALIYSFYFNGTPTSFLSRDEPDGERDSVKRYTALLFNDDSSPRAEAHCEVSSMGSNPYGLVGCFIRNGAGFIYLSEQ